ncbi:hypothetical protein CANINC_003209 [Pichia inconspicua]|uniref:Phosphatidate phosphatase APP1 catalytic domain-containing protein n=1 Tax=Pichia inconspicua TaxID=52247 RepID=A0A4T0WZB4_9ASCO|nr:hypothetical protein CANINC_003209 [[Candida] inconspicua]
MHNIHGQNESNQEEKVSNLIKNKLIGAYRTAKESPYVKSLYQETASAFNVSTDSTSAVSKDISIPENSSIVIYPNYSRVVDGVYITRVKGVVTTNGPLSRKSRFLLSMARRLTKVNDSEEVDSGEFASEIRDALTYQENTDMKPSSQDEYDPSISSTSNDVVKERMEGILTKVVARTPLNIVVGSEEPVDELSSVKLQTDNFGTFQIAITTDYKPSYVAVSSDIDESLLQTAVVEILDPKGVSIITDIDDTIRLTGVLGEKREMFRNIFSKPFSSCEIPGVSEWYQDLRRKFNCPFHYVSNSPWQIFNIVHGFMQYLNFPITSIHLRQYSGNIVSSFTQPSAERKRPSLVNLFEEFPERKFILVGDTGEQDLEAYMSLIPQFAPQILAIYMRVVPTSLSSIGNDDSALEEIKDILDKRNSIKNKDVQQFFNNPTGVDSDGSDNEEFVTNQNGATSYNFGLTKARRRSSLSFGAAKNTFNTAVQMSGVKKLAPIVPRKPESLRGIKLDQNLNLEVPEATIKSNVESKLSTIEPTGTTISESNVNGQPQMVDKRRAIWRAKAQRIVDEVPQHIDVKFWETPEDIKASSIELISKEID